eukprot:CAMPEP_0197323220 /NCGR_PEP_ID=MMETSP0891-20130614/70381_1 /TAXON_ID=44058 ORGANISM="Aureoumbra lagunensis, Strain CCMP1510" /NCGR_SAMPLE_ID=MMETSP0891 /ASSEMBLY_ACC=CAM_ASM_000534 /LENGTH=1331 /DNA_ID=CAMNT_0042815807 /DNA_START=1 /DNA_END=3996 /DNA_ORIENTATION=-
MTRSGRDKDDPWSQKPSKPAKAHEVLKQKLHELSIQAAFEIGQDDDEEAIALQRQAVKTENLPVKTEFETEYDELLGMDEAANIVEAAKKVKGLCDLPPRIESSRNKRRIPLHGVKVAFPFDEPLKPQRLVMERVVHAIIHEQTALLESPTGTGKTQALLSAALGAVRYLKLLQKPRVGKIIYATRTIGQVQQLPNELRKNPYITTSSPLASRNHYCTNHDLVGKGPVSSGGLAQQCRKLGKVVEKGRERGLRDEEDYIQNWDDNNPDFGLQSECGCPHYRWLTASGEETNLAARPVCSTKNKENTSTMKIVKQLLPDLEDMQGIANMCDLKKIAEGRPLVGPDGKKRINEQTKKPISIPGPCAYYQARALADQSLIIFCPYNYLMDHGIRNAVGIETHLDNAIVIIDEAHNVEQVARDGGSSTLSLFDIYELERFLLYRFSSTRKKRKETKGQMKIDDSYYYEDDNKDDDESLLQVLQSLRRYLEDAEIDFCGDEDEEDEEDCTQNVAHSASSNGSLPSPPVVGSFGTTATKKEIKKLSQAQISLRERQKWKRSPEERDVVRGWDWGAAGGRPKSEGFFERFKLTKAMLVKAAAQAAEISEAAREMDDDSFVLGDQCVSVAKVLLMCYKNRVHYAICVRAWHNAGSEFPQSFEKKDRNSNMQQPQQQREEDTHDETKDAPNNSSQQQQQEHDSNNKQEQQTFIGIDGNISTIKHKLSKRSRARQAEGSYLPTRKDEPQWGFELCLWLLHPGVVIDDIASRVRTLILASGTLSPVLQTERELGIKFSQRMRRKALEACHVCSTTHQLAVRAVTTASVLPGKPPVLLECKANSFSDFTSEGRMRVQALGETIARLASSAPGGILVFLPSNKLLKQLVNAWKSNSRVVNSSASSSKNIWQRLVRYKRTVLCENSDSASNDEIIECYRKAIDRDKSALLFAVYRGKCSEGISYNDDACRLVIAVGIPFPPAFDHLVMRKKDYNDSKIKGGLELGCGQNGQPKADKDCMSGSTWYTCQAYRALNQALGRCLRHLNDWGALVLVDYRFNELHARHGVAAWLRDALQPGTLDQVAKHLDTHYDTARKFVERDFRERMNLPPLQSSADRTLSTDTKHRRRSSGASTLAPISQDNLTTSVPSLKEENPFSQYKYEPPQPKAMQIGQQSEPSVLQQIPPYQTPLKSEDQPQHQPIKQKENVIDDDFDFYDDDEVVEISPPPVPTPEVIDLVNDDDNDELMPDVNQSGSSKRHSPTAEPLSDDIPQIFYCKLTHQIMSDPVFAADGYTYSRCAIQAYLDASGANATSPVTGIALENFNLIPNNGLKNEIMNLKRKMKRLKP